MRTTEAPDAVKQREKEQRDLEKSIERQKKEEARQLAEPVVPAQPLVAQAEVKPELPPVDVDVDIPVVKTD